VRAVAVVACIIAGLATSVAAQPASPPPGSPAGAKPPANRSDKVRAQIRARIAVDLTSQLELDEVTAGKIFAVMARFDEQFDKVLVARADIQRKLKTADSIKDPKALEHLIDDAVANQHALEALEDQRLTDWRKILTPQQTAQLLVVWPAIQRRLQNQLQRAVANPGAAPKGRANNRRPPGDDNDDD
jgi:Spy/CpxP family protein refolding chaperone